MGKSGKAELLKAKSFLRRLQEMVESLPTEEQKAETKARIGDLVEFLNTLRSAVDAMPSVDDLSKVKEALAHLEILFSKAEANPVLAGLVPRMRSPRTAEMRQPASEQDLASAKVELSRLRTMPIEQIREELLVEDGYPVSHLRTMAVSLGIGASGKLSRESLAHQISTKIANARGYEVLSGRAASE